VSSRIFERLIPTAADEGVGDDDMEGFYGGRSATKKKEKPDLEKMVVVLSKLSQGDAVFGSKLAGAQLVLGVAALFKLVLEPFCTQEQIGFTNTPQQDAVIESDLRQIPLDPSMFSIFWDLEDIKMQDVSTGLHKLLLRVKTASKTFGMRFFGRKNG